MNSVIIPVSAILPTANRSWILLRTLSGLLSQSSVPAEIIVIDASSSSNHVMDAINDKVNRISGVQLKYVTASQKGATVQRMKGLELAAFPTILFLDDDLILEEHCIERLWRGFSTDERVGAVNAMITNQRYTSPGFVSRTMYRIMSGQKLASYAGKVIGPAWNLLPEDEPGLPDYVRCEWLNTTCTMYKREAMPTPVFADFFSGYSMFEDLTLSSLIRRNYLLLNARTARIFHDSQPGDHKNNVAAMSRMALVNRYYVMTRVLHRTQMKYIFKLFLLESFGMITSLRTASSWKNLPRVVWGKISGIRDIVKMKESRV